MGDQFQLIRDVHSKKLPLSALHDISADSFERDEDGRSPLHHAASLKDHEIVAFFLSNGHSPATKDDEGWTSLHIAASQKDIGTSKLLLATSSADQPALVGFVNIQSSSGMTALHYACSKQSIELVSLLLNASADPKIKNNLGQNPAHRAAAVGNLDIIKMLHSTCPSSIKETDSEGSSVL
ncbi:putative ankyrin-repeat protein [Mitosporidium daphniae]